MDVWKELKSRFRSEERCVETSCKDDEDIAYQPGKSCYPPSRSQIGRAAWRYLHTMAIHSGDDQACSLPAQQDELRPSSTSSSSTSSSSAAPATSPAPASFSTASPFPATKPGVLDSPLAPPKQESLRDWLVGFIQFYPCSHCAESFVDIVAQKPPDFSTPRKYATWWAYAHNQVRRDLSQPIIVRESARDFNERVLAENWRGKVAVDESG